MAMKSMSALAVMLAAAFPAAAGQFALRPGMGGVPDLGAISCATFNEMYPAGPNGLRQAVLYWAEGYFYARTGQTLDQVLQRRGETRWDFDSLTGVIVDFCAANPEAKVSAAVENLWQRLD